MSAAINASIETSALYNGVINTIDTLILFCQFIAAEQKEDKHRPKTEIQASQRAKQVIVTYEMQTTYSS
jgi:hypothetical protein